MWRPLGTCPVCLVLNPALRAVAGDATQGVYLYRPSGMAHGSNTDSATVAWLVYILLDSTEYIFFLGRIL